MNSIEAELDDHGATFFPGRCSKAYGYDANGKMVTETLTDSGGVVRVKTYTRNAAGKLTGESVWVRS